MPFKQDCFDEAVRLRERGIEEADQNLQAMYNMLQRGRTHMSTEC
jgi:hypothetical protein